jgi:glycosyltransferase involved in cell wall biosynthesis
VIAQLVTGLGARHDVGLLHLQGREDDEPDEDVRRACDFVEGVPRPYKGGSLTRHARIGTWLATGKPVWVAEWWAPEFASRLREIAAEWQPDVVQIEFHVMAQYIDALGGCPAPRVLTEHEAGVLAARDERRFRTGVAAVALALDQRAWRRYERAVLARVDSVAVFSQRDRDVLSALGSACRLRQIPLGVSIPALSLGAPQAGAAVVFVGSFRHPPNIDAAIRLARDIHPRVRTRYPGTRLYIVGEDPPARLAALSQDDVIITGRVADVTPYLNRAAVVAVPIRFGGGVRVKVLEAMAAGKAVVASPLAAAEVAKDQLALAESDDEFVEAIVQLLRNPEERSALGSTGRQWVTAHASTRLMVDSLEAIHDSVLAERLCMEG